MTEFRGAFEPKKLPDRTVRMQDCSYRAEENMSKAAKEIWTTKGSREYSEYYSIEPEGQMETVKYVQADFAAEQNKRLREALERLPGDISDAYRDAQRNGLDTNAAVCCMIDEAREIAEQALKEQP